MDRELRAELTQLQDEWLEHLRRWERSGVTLKAYAQREGLSHRRLYRFKRLLIDKGVYREGDVVSRRFVRAQIKFEREPVSLCRVRFRNGCVVELGGELKGVALGISRPSSVPAPSGSLKANSRLTGHRLPTTTQL